MILALVLRRTNARHLFAVNILLLLFEKTENEWKTRQGMANLNTYY